MGGGEGRTVELLMTGKDSIVGRHVAWKHGQE